jgi:hypothetical protein
MRVLERLAAMTPEQWAEHDAKIRAERERSEAEAAKAARAASVMKLGLPPRVLEIVAGATWPTDATKALEGDALITCLSGNPGNGKTVAAASWLFKREVGLFVKAAQLARWERYSDEKMRLLLGSAALVVDDLGTEYQDVKGNLMALIDELLDHRYDYRLPTVLTTNLDAEAFKARYGERIADRIREVGAFVSIDAPSFRRTTP